MDDEFFDRLRGRVLVYFEERGNGIEHADRVCDLSLKISEGDDVDLDVVRVAALLHDVARSMEKRNDVATGSGKDIDHSEEGAKMADGILREMGFSEEKIGKVAYAIRVHRYSRGLKAETREAEILQDADRLDALGAVIIVRMIKAAVKWGTPVYDPSIPIREKYDGAKLSVINHIYEKILKMTPDSFNTEKAREIARGRYDFVKEFAERYIKEVEGEL